MARSICSGLPPRACTIQSAIRSAERGPTPGICRSCATKSRSAGGYSVFLKTRPCLPLPHRHFGQIQRERLKAAEIQLQRRVFFLVRPTRLLKFGIRLSPTFLAIKHDAVPETIASRQLFGVRLRRRPERFVNFVALARIHTAEKINRTCDNVSARQFKRSWSDQNSRTIKTVRHTKTPCEFNRFTARDQSRPLTILKRRDNHCPGAYAKVHIAFRFAVGETRLPKLVDHVQCHAHCFVAMMCVRFRKTKERHHPLGIGRLNVSTRLHENIRRAANKFSGNSAEYRRITILRE